MRKNIIITICALFSMLRGFAVDYNLSWQKANQFYTQKQYDSAVYYFEQIAALKPQDAVVYYNLGNAYYRLNNIPSAVLNYERALRINPEYKAANENLALTRTRISNRIQPSSNIFFIAWWQSLTQSDKASKWAIISLVTFVIIIACMLAMRFSKNKDSIPPQVVGVLSFAWVIFLILSFAATQSATSSKSAVIMQNDAPLMNEEQKGKPLSLIPAGTTIEIEEVRNNWAEVRLPDGRSGWVQETLFTRI